MTSRRNAVVTMDALQDLVGHLRDLREERKAVLVVTAGWPFEDEGGLLAAGRNETDACAQDRAALGAGQLQGEAEGADEGGESSERVVLSRQLASDSRPAPRAEGIGPRVHPSA